MSVDTGFFLKIVQRGSNNILTPVTILEMLINNGWNVISSLGDIGYTAIGDSDLIDWQSSKMNITELMLMLKIKESKKEPLGIIVWWEETGAGDSLLLYDEKTMEERGLCANMCLSLGIRKTIVDSQYYKIPDINWYLMKMLPVFNTEDVKISYFTYEELA